MRGWVQLVNAEAHGAPTTTASQAMDSWGLGMLAYEIFAG